MRILKANKSDISELYALQLLSFESEAEMIGSRQVPALLESEDENAADFANWDILKLVDDDGKIIGAIRSRQNNGIVEIGRLMVHPDHRRCGLAQFLLSEIDKAYPNDIKELYTCTKSWINIRLYEKMGYKAYKEHTEENGLSFVYMRKPLSI